MHIGEVTDMLEKNGSKKFWRRRGAGLVVWEDRVNRWTFNTR